MGIDNSIMETMFSYAEKLNDHPPLTMIDIGSFRGGVSHLFVNRFADSVAYAIEACPRNCKSMSGMDKRIRSRNIAISDCNCLVELNVVDHKKYGKSLSSQANSLYKSFTDSKKWAEKKKIIKVPGMTLDKFIESESISRIDLLKINCEGCEYKIFESKTLNFLDVTNVIFLQMHGKSEEFNSPEFLEKRKTINRILMEKYTLAMGPSPHKVAKPITRHTEQIWVKQ